jgi:hypothetical protein
MSLTSGMNLEAGATGQDIATVRNAPLVKRLVLAPVGLIAAEAGAQAGIFLEDQLADVFGKKDKKGRQDENWRAKVLLGKVLLSVLVYPFSAPLALGVAASGGLLHLLLGWATFAEREDQANQRAKQLIKLDEKPKGRFTQQKRKAGKDDEEKEDEDEDKKKKESDEDSEPAQAETGTIDLAAKLTDPDVLHTYGKAAELAFERLIQQGHLPPGTRPVLNDALVQEVQALVRDTQKKAA